MVARDPVNSGAGLAGTKMIYFSFTFLCLELRAGGVLWVKRALETPFTFPEALLQEEHGSGGKSLGYSDRRSYLHQREEVVHHYSHRVLQPALVNDVQTLLLSLLLSGITDVPQAVS